MRCSPDRRLLAVASCALAWCAAGTVTASASAPDRATALAAYRSVQQDERVGDGWTGSTSSCSVGTESSDSLAATLRTVNTLRSFAGVGPVAFDDQLDHEALAAALMMAAAGSLSHIPGPTWPCYSPDGALAAGSSNLFLGESGPAAMVGYVDDDGVDVLGHRRWLLDPEAAIFGSGSTGTTNALYVITNGTVPVAPGTSVSWPPAGWVPWQWIFRDWSLAVGAPDQAVTFQNPSVTVTIDGVPTAVGDVTQLDGGYGTGATLKWQVDVGSQLTQGDHTIQVAVQGAVADGQPLPVSWTIDAFQPDPPAPRFVSPPKIRRPGGPGSTIRFGQQLVASATVVNATITSYRWRRGGRTIGDATHATYKVRHRDDGHTLTVRVTATAPDGRTVQRTSPAVHVRG